MKSFYSLTLIAVLAGSSMAFGSDNERVTALKKYRNEMATALREMRHCLPIYNGHLAKAQSATAESIKDINGIIVSLEPPAPPKAPTPSSVQAKESKETRKGVNTKVEPPKTTSTKVVEPPKPAPKPDVKESQQSLRNALMVIQKAKVDLKELEEALGKDKATEIAKLLETAEAEATAAIAVHEKEG